MPDVTRVTFTFEDRYQNAAKIIVHFPVVLSGPLDTLATALLALLNTALNSKGVRIEMSVVVGVGGSPTSGAYDTVEDKGVLIMIDEFSSSHRFMIPGPKTAIVSSVDHETIANTGVVATWSAAMIANAVTSGDGEYTEFKRGYRTIARKATKF